MKIILLTHPSFMVAQSMPRFARMLMDAYEARGYQVEMWAPTARVLNWVPSNRKGLRKWAGYVDQYLLFPRWVRQQIKRQPARTLYVFCDQALGPWVPLVRHLPHVIHVHDLLALRSALGEVAENKTRFTGRLYQKYIRRGFQTGRQFISISEHTRADLHRYSRLQAERSEVVYNGLNYPFTPLPTAQANALLAAAGLPVPAHGILLHISGNQWYKNVPGVIHLYAAYARQQTAPLPLWLVGEIGGAAVNAALAEVPQHAQVVRLSNLEATALHACYASAKAFLFPSLEEGFGWPIIEAQACGCPVLTTQQTPMTEVGGPHSVYVARLKASDDLRAWAQSGAQALQKLLSSEPAAQAALQQKCIDWTQRFSAQAAIDGYLKIYQDVINTSLPTVAVIGQESPVCAR